MTRPAIGHPVPVPSAEPKQPGKVDCNQHPGHDPQGPAHGGGEGARAPVQDGSRGTGGEGQDTGRRPAALTECTVLTGR